MCFEEGILFFGLCTLMRAVDYAPNGAVDFPALWARAHISGPAALWITRAVLAVD